MLKPLKRTLVESYIGAIALGYLLAQAVLRLSNVFAWPLTEWASHKEVPQLMHGVSTEAVMLRDVLTQSAAFLILLLLWYVLFRWLYLKPFRKDEPGPEVNSEQAV